MADEGHDANGGEEVNREAVESGRDASEVPASCSFRIPMICSSVKRLRLMFWSSRWARTNFKLDYPRGATSRGLSRSGAVGSAATTLAAYENRSICALAAVQLAEAD